MWWTRVARCLVLPPGILLLLALAGLLLLRRGRWRAGWTLVGVALGALYILSIPTVSLPLARGLEGYPTLAPGQAETTEVIVVLGGGLIDSPEYDLPIANASSLARCRYALRLHRQTGLPILTSSGNHETYSEAAAMRDVLQEFGVSEVWLEERSRNTWENALFCKPILEEHGAKRILLVTAAAHMARAVRSFETLGFEVVPAPTQFVTVGPWDRGLLAIVPQARCFAQSSFALEEWLGRAWYRLRYGA